MNTSNEVTFSREKLEEYYNGMFFDDMSRYYDITTSGYGADVINANRHNNMRCYYPVHRTLVGMPNGTYDEEMMFYGLLCAMKKIQELLCCYVDSIQLGRFMKSMNWPMLMGDFKEKMCRIPSHKPEDVYHKVMEVAFPFLKEMVSVQLHQWYNHYFEDQKSVGKNDADFLVGELEEMNTRMIREKSRHFHPGLSGTELDTLTYCRYFRNNFMEQFRDYFFLQPDHEDYPLVLKFDDGIGRCDGDPAHNAIENYMFAATVLYFILAEKSVNMHAGNEAEDSFHRCSGWPQLYCEPREDAMKLLAEGYLMPTREEVLFFRKAFEIVCKVQGEKFRAVIKGNNVVDSAEWNLFKTRTTGHIRSCIKRQVETFADQVRKQLTDMVEDNGLDKEVK